MRALCVALSVLEAQAAEAEAVGPPPPPLGPVLALWIPFRGRDKPWALLEASTLSHSLLSQALIKGPVYAGPAFPSSLSSLPPSFL